MPFLASPSSIHADAEIQVVDLSPSQRIRRCCCHAKGENGMQATSAPTTILASDLRDIGMKQSAKCHETGLCIYPPVQNRYVAHTIADKIIFLLLGSYPAMPDPLEPKDPFEGQRVVGGRHVCSCIALRQQQCSGSTGQSVVMFIGVHYPSGTAARDIYF